MNYSINFKSILYDYLLKQGKLKEKDINTSASEFSVFDYTSELSEFLKLTENSDTFTLSKSLEDYKKGVSSENDIIDELYKELIKNESFFKAVDADGNGNISDEEQNKFFEIIKNLDGNEQDISAEDMLKAANKIKENNFSELTPPDTQAEAIEITSSPEVSAPSGGNTTSSTSGANSAGQAPQGTSGAQKDEIQEVPVDKMSDSELNSKLTEAQASLKENEDLANSIMDDSHPELAAALKQVQDAYDNYQNAVNEVAPELAEQLDKYVQDLSAKDAEINEQNKVIMSQEEAVSDAKAEKERAESTVSSLEANLSSLKSKDRSNLTEEQIAELNAKISETESQLNAAKQKVEEAQENIETQEKNLKTEQDKLEDLDEEKTEIEEGKNELEQQIAELSPEINELMNNYNSLKSEYDQIKAQCTTEVKNVIAEEKAYIQEIQKEISTRADKKNVKDNLSFSTEPDLFRSDIEMVSDYVRSKDGMSYLIMHPDDIDPNEELPMLVYLHGSGEVGTDETGIKSVGPGKIIPDWEKAGLDNFNGIIVCPILPSDGTNNTRWEKAEVAAQVDDVVSQVREKYNINDDKIAIAGHSLGSYGAIYIGNNSETQYCAIAQLSGYSLAGVDPSQIDVPVYGFVGSVDSGERDRSAAYMNGEFAQVFGQNNLHVYKTSHAGLPKAVLTEDANKDGHSDFIQLLYGNV